MNSRQNNSYEVKLAGDLLKACESKTADFLNTSPIPYYTQDMITKRVLHDAAQLGTLLNNAAQGSQYIYYTPTYVIQDTKKELGKNINKNQSRVGCIVYKGRDENGNKHYDMMSPAGRYHPGGVKESPMSQEPVPNVAIHRQEARLDLNDPKGIEKYITAVIANYFNAAFTKTPYYAPQWGRQETAMLSNALNADPSLAMRVPQQAYSQAVNMGNNININNALDPGRQNGYVPYQTHNERPQNIDNYLVEQCGNMINASLTGTPYTGSIPADSLRERMKNEPEYMGRIVSRARQNVDGFNYMPYDKDAFITRAQDFSSREFGVLNQTIIIHVNDICRNNKRSFNGEFQELSKPLVEKIKSEQAKTAAEKKPAAKKTTGAAGSGTSGASGAGGGEKKTAAKKTTAKKTAANKTTAASAAGDKKTAAKKTTAKKPSAGALGGAPGGTPGAGGAATGGEKKEPAVNANAEKKDGKNPVNTTIEKIEKAASVAENVTDFVKKNIVDKKVAPVMFDTFLGTFIDKAQKIIRTGKSIAAAFVIATNLLAPNLQMPIANHLARMPINHSVSISMNQNDIKSAAQGIVKAGGQIHQIVKSAARR